MDEKELLLELASMVLTRKKRLDGIKIDTSSEEAMMDSMVEMAEIIALDTEMLEHYVKILKCVGYFED